MKLASYNVENLFQRARVMNLPSQADGKDVLQMHAEMNGILNQTEYTAGDKKRIVTLMKALGIDKKDDGGEFVILRQNRGHLVKRPKSGGLDVIANGRGAWLGWLDLKMEAVNEVSTRMTGRVIQSIGAEVIALIEAESRPSLLKFHDDVLALAKPVVIYDHIMLIDGNDDRGIDVAIMTQAGFRIKSMRSHVDDEKKGRRIFSRDCAEYHIRTPAKNKLVVLVNHFKSKGFGSQAESSEKRRMQAERVAAIYKRLRDDGAKHIAIVGDFNDTPDSDPLLPLLKDTDLEDITKHPDFDDGGRPGTFANGAKSNKIDYILLSPALFKRATGGTIFRMGVWGGTHGTLFPHFPEITRAEEAASDHAAIVAEIDLA